MACWKLQIWRIPLFVGVLHRIKMQNEPALSFQSKSAQLISGGRHGCENSVRYVSLCFLITLFCVEYKVWSTGVEMFFLEKTNIKGNSYHVLDLLNCFFLVVLYL